MVGMKIYATGALSGHHKRLSPTRLWLVGMWGAHQELGPLRAWVSSPLSSGLGGGCSAQHCIVFFIIRSLSQVDVHTHMGRAIPFFWLSNCMPTCALSSSGSSPDVILKKRENHSLTFLIAFKRLLRSRLLPLCCPGTECWLAHRKAG